MTLWGGGCPYPILQMGPRGPRRSAGRPSRGSSQAAECGLPRCGGVGRSGAWGRPSRGVAVRAHAWGRLLLAEFVRSAAIFEHLLRAGPSARGCGCAGVPRVCALSLDGEPRSVRRVSLVAVSRSRRRVRLQGQTLKRSGEGARLPHPVGFESQLPAGSGLGGPWSSLGWAVGQRGWGDGSCWGRCG